MRRSLGRTYPSDVQNGIRGLGEALDDLMASSFEFVARTDTDVSDEIRDLNARLVNDVIIVSDQITDEEARRRLFEVQKEVFALQSLFKQEGIPIRQYAPVATRTAAEELASKLRQAYDLYPEVVDRYARIRPGMETMAGLPIAGGAVAALLAGFDRKIRAIDEDVFFARDSLKRLDDMLAEVGPGVQIEPETYRRMQAWAGGVFEADEALKRLEGIAARKPAERPPSKAPAFPWKAVAVIGGVALVGLVAIAAATGKN